MADLVTIALSVSASVAVQSFYFVWTQFPSDARTAAAELVHQIKSQRSKSAITRSLLECLDRSENLLYRCLSSFETLNESSEEELHSLACELDDLHGTLTGLNFSSEHNYLQYLGEHTLVALEESKRNMLETTANRSKETMSKNYVSVNSAFRQAKHLSALYISEQSLELEKANAAMFSLKRRYRISSWVFVAALSVFLSYLTNIFLKRFSLGTRAGFAIETVLAGLFLFILGRFAQSDWTAAFKVLTELKETETDA